MTLDNDQIAAHIKTLLADYIKSVKTKSDEASIEAGAALITNFLQNLNDLAYCAVNADQRADRQ